MGQFVGDKGLSAGVLKKIEHAPTLYQALFALIQLVTKEASHLRLSVRENLVMGAYTRPGADLPQDLETVYNYFPILADKADQQAAFLSGGQQQMLAIGRALMSNPKLLCIDEPSTGLAPIMKEEVFKKIEEIKNMGITVLLVEQEVSAVFAMAGRNYVLSSGKIIAEGTGDDLMQDEVLRKTYLGL